MEPECKAIFAKLEKTLTKLDRNIEGLREDIAELRGDVRKVAETLLAPVERKALSSVGRPAARAPLAAKPRR